MDNKEAGAQLKDLIMGHLDDDKRSILWLAGSIKMNYSTLRGQIKDRPAKLSVFTLLAIEQALDLPVGVLLFPYFSTPLVAA